MSDVCCILHSAYVCAVLLKRFIVPQALSGTLHLLSNFTLRTPPSSLKILPGNTFTTHTLLTLDDYYFTFL